MPLEILAKEGLKLGAKLVGEAGKKISKLGTELSKIGARESNTASNLIKNGIDKAKTALNETADKESLAMKMPVEPRKNYISFMGESNASFPWKNHDFMSPEEIEKSIQKTELNKYILREERRPDKLPTDISKRLTDEWGLLPEQMWANATPDERVGILNRAFEIMAEEACIPQNMIENGKVVPHKFMDKEGTHTNAAVNFFLDLDENGNFYKTSDITIKVNVDDLLDPNQSFTDSISSLYHEVVHAMQQQSLCEGGNTFTYAEMQKEWKESVTDRIYKFRLNEVGIKLPEDDSFVAYVTDPMETWAHMQTEYFSKIYDGYRGDEIMSFEKILNEAEGDFKSLNIGGNRVLSPLIYNPNDK